MSHTVPARPELMTLCVSARVREHVFYFCLPAVCPDVQHIGSMMKDTFLSLKKESASEDKTETWKMA